MQFRNEYPRPQFVRENWQNLNGTWRFDFDDEDQGLKEKWYQDSRQLTQEIQVPFVYQAANSGIGETAPHDIVWYQRDFDWQEEGRCLLHFGAVDYQTKVYLNGALVGEHTGGHTSFSFELTDHVLTGKNSLALRVYDPHLEELIPRGKQFWEAESRGIWYTNTTGIWQTVWLEQVPQAYLKNVYFTPDLDNGAVGIKLQLPEEARGLQVAYEISMEGQVVVADQVTALTTEIKRQVDLYQNQIFRSNFHDDGWTWTPENPKLFDVVLTLKDETGQVVDQVTSYFGMRKIHTEKGMVFLNNHPYYQKLVLDQGYWPEGLLTAPTDEDFKKDIQLSKEMGFNGCRKHQKVEDPRFLYWADQLGYLVWGECASAISYGHDAVMRLADGWGEIITRDYNHPCIVTWVPLNESWGIPEVHHDKQQQSFSETMYHLLHALDNTRLVISNDGWEMTKTDICAIHNYSHGAETETAKYQQFCRSLADVDGLINYPPGKWAVFSEGYYYQHQPILLTEFGGIGYKVGNQAGWGYTSVENADAYLTDYQRIMAAIFASKALWGFCYTQLTDVEQEINGILAYDRTPKVDLAAIKAINDQYYPERIYIEK